MKRFIKGVFELKPTLPKQSHTWDVNTVLNFLETFHSLDKLILKELYKSVMLLAILSGQRCQTIHKLSLDSMCMDDTHIFFLH